MNLSTTKSGMANRNVSTGPAVVALVQRLAQYGITAGLGVLGGATGVALAIAILITIQLFQSPASSFYPGVTLTTLTATILGLGISWLIKNTTRWLMPDLSGTGQRLQVIMVFSVLTSLLQSLLFTQGL